MTFECVEVYDMLATRRENVKTVLQFTANGEIDAILLFLH